MASLSKRLEIKESSLPGYLVFSQSLASIAPLSSMAAYLTATLALAGTSSGIASILGVAMYSLWVYVGYQLSKAFPSEGGTYTFSRNMYPDRMAMVLGWMYWGSYMYYLISTSTYASGVLLPLMGVPGTVDRIAEVILPLAILLLMITGVKPPLYYSLVTSLAEIAVIVILGIAVIGHKGFSLLPLTPSAGIPQVLSGAIATSFTVAGGGASFFLGKEARGKGKTVSISYLIAFLLASGAIAFSSVYLVLAGSSEQGVETLANTGFPGLIVAKQFMGQSFVLVMLVLTINSLVGSLIAAYVALSRLTLSLLKISLPRSTLLVGALFVGIDLGISGSGNLLQWYQYFFLGSSTALFATHTALSLGLPKIRNKLGLNPVKTLPGILSAILMVVGLYSIYLEVGEGLVVGIVSCIVLVMMGVIQGLRR
ncbi:APC family permease [Metallosphaera javensis (ex Sakai et al. 2022)]|uniref:APC family permease n=1 Tax=Metallosphaera javensis (ex Sakai et al. 2022) TaxID=2775498 RepID=UPI002589BB6F|nr:MAG: amino acid permease [Metallosphaera javensis (ex Sakai et al. 2022)]